MELFVGIDPGLHSTGIAAVDGNGTPIALWLIKAEGEKDRDAVVSMVNAIHCFMGGNHLPLPEQGYPVLAAAVEGQELVYSVKSGANPRDLGFLSAVGGSLLLMCSLTWEKCLLLSPAPQAWKGDVPKSVHQARLFKDLGWEFKTSGKEVKRGKNGKLKLAAYAYPVSPPPEILGIEAVTLQTDWKELGDAISLARWARAQHLKIQKRTAILAGKNIIERITVQPGQCARDALGNLISDLAIIDGVSYERQFYFPDGTPATSLGQLKVLSVPDNKRSVNGKRVKNVKPSRKKKKAPPMPEPPPQVSGEPTQELPSADIQRDRQPQPQDCLQHPGAQ